VFGVSLSIKNITAANIKTTKLKYNGKNKGDFIMELSIRLSLFCNYIILTLIIHCGFI
jgi:hypothetical protein